jgi:hypothetical protein
MHMMVQKGAPTWRHTTAYLYNCRPWMAAGLGILLHMVLIVLVAASSSRLYPFSMVSAGILFTWVGPQLNMTTITVLIVYIST